MDYGIWTLLPIVVVVAVALKSRRALEPLILGTLLTYIIVDGLSFPVGWMDAFFRVATDQSHQWVFMVCGLFGALIALLGASHGTLGFSRLLGRLCRGPRTTLIVTWVMGILIFVDDYLNIMTLSTCMRKLTDRQKVPRETLSYIIDSTGAPVCALLPFSTWAVFFAGLFYAEAGIPGLGYGGAINTFCAVIPFVFYAIAAVALVPLFSLGLVPKLGRMKKAYRRVEETGKVYSPESAELNLEDEDDSPAITGCLWDFVLPIGTLIALTIVGGELFLALVAAIAVCFLLYIPRKKLSLTRFCDLAMHGFCNLRDKVVVEVLGRIGRRRAAEIRPAAVLHVGAQRDVRDDQRVAADVDQRAVHLAVIVLEDAHLADLLREKIGLLLGIARHGAHENDDTLAGFTRFVSVDCDESAVDALDNCPHGISLPLPCRYASIIAWILSCFKRFCLL